MYIGKVARHQECMYARCLHTFLIIMLLHFQLTAHKTRPGGLQVLYRLNGGWDELPRNNMQQYAQTNRAGRDYLSEYYVIKIYHTTGNYGEKIVWRIAKNMPCGGIYFRGWASSHSEIHNKMAYWTHAGNLTRLGASFGSVRMKWLMIYFRGWASSHSEIHNKMAYWTHAGNLTRLGASFGSVRMKWLMTCNCKLYKLLLRLIWTVFSTSVFTGWDGLPKDNI